MAESSAQACVVRGGQEFGRVVSMAMRGDGADVACKWTGGS